MLRKLARHVLSIWWIQIVVTWFTLNDWLHTRLHRHSFKWVASIIIIIKKFSLTLYIYSYPHITHTLSASRQDTIRATHILSYVVCLSKTTSFKCDRDDSFQHSVHTDILQSTRKHTGIRQAGLWMQYSLYIFVCLFYAYLSSALIKFGAICLLFIFYFSVSLSHSLFGLIFFASCSGFCQRCLCVMSTAKSLTKDFRWLYVFLMSICRFQWANE